MSMVENPYPLGGDFAEAWGEGAAAERERASAREGEKRPVMPNISAAGPSVYKPDKGPAPPVPEGQDEASKSNPDEQEVDGA